MGNRTTVATLSLEVTSEADAYAYFEKLRWHGNAVCAHCQSLNVYFIEPSNDVSRATRTGAQSEPRVWRRRECKRQFSVMTNIMMHHTKILIRIWLMVIFELCSSKNGVAAREVERKYGVAGRSAWFMLHRIREAMSHETGNLFAGDVVSDETFIGGEPKNRNFREDGKSRRYPQKTPVMSLIDGDTGEARSQVIPNVTARTLRKVIVNNVDVATTTLHTDGWKVCSTIGMQLAGHHVVDHSAGQYVTEKSNGTNMAENYFSQLKRSLDGTHHHISKEHLNRYLAEFDYRYRTFEKTDTERMANLANRVGRTTDLQGSYSLDPSASPRSISSSASESTRAVATSSASSP
jgi:transposase-like protein